MAEHIASLLAGQGTHDVASRKSLWRLVQRTVAFQYMREPDDFESGNFQSPAGRVQLFLTCHGHSMRPKPEWAE